MGTLASEQCSPRFITVLYWGLTSDSLEANRAWAIHERRVNKFRTQCPWRSSFLLSTFAEILRYLLHRTTRLIDLLSYMKYPSECVSLWAPALVTLNLATIIYQCHSALLNSLSLIATGFQQMQLRTATWFDTHYRTSILFERIPLFLHSALAWSVHHHIQCTIGC